MAKAPDDLSVRSDLAASLSEEMIGEKTNEDFGSDLYERYTRENDILPEVRLMYISSTLIWAD